MARSAKEVGCPAQAGAARLGEPQGAACASCLQTLLPAMQETQFDPWDQEDTLEKEIHSNILPGKSHGYRNLEGYRSRG